MRFPSDIQPAPPTVRLTLPPDWTQVWLPATLIAARGADRDGYVPTVTVAHREVPAPFDADSFTGDLERWLEGRSGGDGDLRVKPDREIGGTTWWVRELALHDDRAGTLAQVHLATVRPREGVSQVVHLVGTFGAADPVADAEVIHGILQSIELAD